MEIVTTGIVGFEEFEMVFLGDRLCDPVPKPFCVQINCIEFFRPRHIDVHYRDPNKLSCECTDGELQDLHPGLLEKCFATYPVEFESWIASRRYGGKGYTGVVQSMG